MNLPLSLIIASIVLILALIVFPLIISFKSEKENFEKNEWEKIKDYGNNINKKSREKRK